MVPVRQDFHYINVLDKRVQNKRPSAHVLLRLAEMWETGEKLPPDIRDPEETQADGHRLLDFSAAVGFTSGTIYLRPAGLRGQHTARNETAHK